MSQPDTWVMDVTMDAAAGELGLHAFCPVMSDGSILVGLTVLTASPPPGRFVGFFHEDGPGACHDWMVRHMDVVMTLTPGPHGGLEAP